MMQPAYEIPRFTTSRSPASEIDADLVAVPIPQNQLAEFTWLDQVTGGELSAAFARAEFVGKPFEVWTASINGPWRAKRVIAVGTGPVTELDSERARRVGSCIGLTARQQKRERLAVALDASWSDLTTEALAEGAALANYDNGHYKSRHEDRFF